ncbi:MAG TPA: HIT family protein [Bacteroidota bacterium]|nr:HIT family protein [Bacteroidota bacterium]
MGCIFCDIISGASPAEILFEGPQSIAILDINPIHYGHALVLPKRHCQTFIDVPECDLADVMNTLSVVSRAIVLSLKPTGFNLFSNNGQAAGQSVMHFHFHVTPRYDNDNIKFILELKKYPEQEILQYARKIRESIARAPAAIPDTHSSR